MSKDSKEKRLEKSSKRKKGLDLDRVERQRPSSPSRLTFGPRDLKLCSPGQTPYRPNDFFRVFLAFLLSHLPPSLIPFPSYSLHFPFPFRYFLHALPFPYPFLCFLLSLHPFSLPCTRSLTPLLPPSVIHSLSSSSSPCLSRIASLTLPPSLSTLSLQQLEHPAFHWSHFGLAQHSVGDSRLQWL